MQPLTGDAPPLSPATEPVPRFEPAQRIEYPLGPTGQQLTPSGRMEVSPLATTTYVGTFTGSAGTATCSTTLTVRP